MGGQLESPHYFRMHDLVQDRDGLLGTVLESQALYAIVAWPDGRQEEIEQFDPGVVVVERAQP